MGGVTLANILAALGYRRAVAACGLADGTDFPASVIPFLLRGIRLIGIDSVLCPLPQRRAAWDRLAQEMPKDKLAALTQKVPLEALSDLGPGLGPGLGKEILEGRIRGRIVVEIAP